LAAPIGDTSGEGAGAMVGFLFMPIGRNVVYAATRSN
jgi:hypothetical protein